MGYRFLDDLAFSEEQKEVMSKHSDLREVGSDHYSHQANLLKQVMNVLTDAEIRDVLWSKLAVIPGPVQVEHHQNDDNNEDDDDFSSHTGDLQ